MRIENPEKIKKEGFLRIRNIEPGACFTFLDDDELYMNTDREEYVVVSNGEVRKITDMEEDRPIREIYVKVTILESF